MEAAIRRGRDRGRFYLQGKEMIRITDSVSLAEHEVHFTFSRSGGPGGQHVNTSATAATLVFHPASSGSLTPEQKRRIERRLGNRLTGDGTLLVRADNRRSQKANRDEALERFREILARALARRKKRKPTRPTRASRERRLSGKKHRGWVKRKRGPVEPGE